MKKTILLLFIITLGLSLKAQDTTAIKQKHSVSGYIATGISITNSKDFLSANYVSVEGGVMYRNAALGTVFGRNNLDFSGNETADKYWVELKSAYYVDVKVVDLYGLLGIGSYLAKNSVFIEFGAGASKSFGNVGLFAQWSNWDAVNYVTTGVSYSF